MLTSVPKAGTTGKPQREKTAFLAEYGSTGKGQRVLHRASHGLRKLGDADVKQFSVEYFLERPRWLGPVQVERRLAGANAPDWKLVSWNDVFKQKPQWYQTDEAARIGDQLLLYQKDNGGFEKNVDMAADAHEARAEKLLASKKGETSETTIDNRTTYPQVAYLARVITASMLKASPPANLPKYKEAFNKGLDYLLASQYENGGFPQFYPLKKGYYSHITFNDDAMIGVLRVLRDIAKKKDDYSFVDEERRLKAETAVEKAIGI